MFNAIGKALAGIFWRFLTGPFIKRFAFGIFGLLGLFFHGIKGVNLLISLGIFCGFALLFDFRGYFQGIKDGNRRT